MRGLIAVAILGVIFGGCRGASKKTDGEQGLESPGSGCGNVNGNDGKADEPSPITRTRPPILKGVDGKELKYEKVGKFGDVTYQMTEQSHRGDIILPPRRTWEVDVNSDLLLSFEMEKATSENESKWKKIAILLGKFRDELTELKAARGEINSAPDDQFTTALRSQAVAINRQAITLMRKFDASVKSIDPTANAADILTGEDGFGAPETPYTNMIRWIRARIPASTQVSVEAYLKPNGKKPIALPITGYNKIAAGNLSPTDRTAQTMSPEAKRWANEVIELATETSDAAKAASESEPSQSQRAKVTGAAEEADLAKSETQKRDAATAAAEADKLANMTIFKDIDSLTDARIALREAGIREGDEVSIYLRFWGEGEGDNRRLLHEREYKSKAVLAGWQRVVSPDVIFARAARPRKGGEPATGSKSTDWKMNAAATVNWSYYYANADESVERFMNWWRPGGGIHIAGLDMEDDNVEFGMGVNVSMWGGLFSAGYGWNLMSDSRREYYFIGMDLLQVLGAAQKKVPASE